MATATIEFDAPEGLTLSVELYAFGAVAGASPSYTAAATEQTNDKGLYRADIIGPVEQWYNVRVILAAAGIGRYQVYLKNLAGIYRCGEGVATVADKSGYTDIDDEAAESLSEADPLDILTNAQNPKRVRTDEGTVEERTMTELIEADRYLNAKDAATAAPWGLRIARTIPPDATGYNRPPQ